MKALKILVVLLTCMCSSALHAQVTYHWRPVNLLPGPGGNVERYEMHRIDFLNATSLGMVFSIDESRFDHGNTTGFNMRIQSFEFTPDMEQVYFLETEGDLYRYTIATDDLVYLQDLSPINSPLLYHAYTNTFDITFINDSILYVSGDTHGWYNINTNTFELIRHSPDDHSSTMSPNKEIVNYKVAKYKGSWIYNTWPLSNTLRLFDSLGNPELNTELIDFTPFGYEMFAEPLVVIQYDCDSTVIYQGARIPGESDAYYKVDLEAGTVTYSHPYTEIPGGVLFTVDKHYSNVAWEDCQRRIDLDGDDSTIGGVDFLVDSLCSFVNLPLSDLDIEISNEYPVDSIVIEIIDPRFSQYLYFPIGNYILRYPPNPWQRIINSGITTIAEFEEAIRNAYLFIDNDPSITEVKIRFTVWYGGVAGKEAVATLRLANPLPVAGDNIVREFCEGDPTLTLENILAPNADEGGHFYNSLGIKITALPDYVAPVSDSIYYVVTNGICYDTSQIVNIINPNPEIIPVADTMLCHMDVLNVDLSSHNENITWDDGSTDKVRQINTSGTFSYEVTNIYGCSTNDTFEVTILPPPQVKPIDAQVCDGEIFTFQGKSYDLPGIYQDTLHNSMGCDSLIYAIDFRYYPTEIIEIEGDLGFCEGEESILGVISNHTDILLNGEAVETPFSISEEGVYQLSGYDANGCFDELEFTVTVYQNPIIITMDLLDTIYSKEITLPVRYEGDIESYLWTPAGGLDCSSCPYPALTISQDGTYLISVIDVNGCSAEGTINVTFKKSQYYLPTAIANQPSVPENGVFFLQGSGTTLYSMQIYDRWGNRLYDENNLSINDPSRGWNPQGRYNPGVYIYMITYEENGEKRVIVGDITVL